MIDRSEYVYKNIKLDEIRGVVQNNRLENDRKYGVNYCREVEVKCIVKFLDKMKNEMKNIMIERHNLLGGVNKVMQSSKRMYKFIRPIELILKNEGKLYSNEKKTLKHSFKTG